MTYDSHHNHTHHTFSEPSCHVWKPVYSLFPHSILPLFPFNLTIKHKLDGDKTTHMSNNSIILLDGWWTKHTVCYSIHHMHEFKALCWRIWLAVMYCDIPIHQISGQWDTIGMKWSGIFTASLCCHCVLENSLTLLSLRVKKILLRHLWHLVENMDQVV